MKKYTASLIKLCIGSLIFTGLPLISWGIKDVSGFMAEPARFVYSITAILFQIVIVTIIPTAGSNRGGKENTSFRQRIILMLLQIIPLMIIVLSAYGDRRDIAVFTDSACIRISGLVLFGAGFAWMHWAEAFLGKQFSVRVTIQKNHDLITSGPYRVLRHPRYLGIILFTSGISLVYRSWLALIFVSLLILVLLLRILEEEKLLHQEFGKDWETYSGKTWRLIPFIF